MPDKNGMTSFEFTGIKLALSALAVLPAALIFEGFLVLAPEGENSFWDELYDSSPYIISLLLASIALTLVFQVTLTAMSYLAGAIPVGVASEVKVVVQVLIVSLMQTKQFDTSLLHVLGTALVLGAAVAFSVVKYFKLSNPKKPADKRQLYQDSPLQSNKFRDWCSRIEFF